MYSTCICTSLQYAPLPRTRSRSHSLTLIQAPGPVRLLPFHLAGLGEIPAESARLRAVYVCSIYMIFLSLDLYVLHIPLTPLTTRTYYIHRLSIVSARPI
jgi:hypothetical protein